MVEFVGLIKVNIIRGTNLAIRDMMSSDPYVIISLGHQVSNSIHEKNASLQSCLFVTSFSLLTSVVNEDQGDKEQPESCMEREAYVIDT
jgi:hypothetical protein